MKNTLFLICLFTMLLVGCKTQKQAQTPLPPVVLNNSDSIKVESIIKTEYIPVEVSVDLPNQSETNATLSGSSHVETDLAESDAWINNDGSLGHSIRNKHGQFKAEAFVPQTTEQTNKEAVKIKEVPVPTPYPVEVERKLTQMEQIKLAAFWYLVGAVIVSIGFIFRKSLFTALRKIIRL